MATMCWEGALHVIESQHERPSSCYCGDSWVFWAGCQVLQSLSRAEIMVSSMLLWCYHGWVGHSLRSIIGLDPVHTDGHTASGHQGL